MLRQRILRITRVNKTTIASLCTRRTRTVNRLYSNRSYNLKRSFAMKPTMPITSIIMSQKRHSNFFVMDERTREETVAQIKKDKQEIPSKYPDFVNSVKNVFPKSMLMSEYFFLANEVTSSLGFTDENTMGMAAICRDEITEGCMERIVNYWGKTFNCCSLAGFITIGKTGLGAATAHAPIDAVDGKRRFVFVAMPHIAISSKGVVGRCQREGIEQESNACGALDAIVGELASGNVKIQLNMQDVEQSLVRQRILADLPYGDKPKLDEITKLASDIITNDVDQLLSDNLDVSVYDYVVLTGVQIHGPEDVDWVYPNKMWHVSNQYSGNRKELTLGSV